MESLTFYRFNHTGSFSDNYKIVFEKKGRLPQIVVAKLQTKESEFEKELQRLAKEFVESKGK